LIVTLTIIIRDCAVLISGTNAALALTLRYYGIKYEVSKLRAATEIKYDEWHKGVGF